MDTDTDGFKIISNNNRLINKENINELMTQINGLFTLKKDIMKIELKDIINSFVSTNSKQYLYYILPAENDKTILTNK